MIKFVFFWVIVVSAAIFEGFSIYEVFNGSHVWTGIFAVITALNIRVVAVTTATNKQ